MTKLDEAKERLRIQKKLQSNPGLAEALWPVRSEYWPENHDPYPKQILFLMLPHREAFYGGAAGGGKSEALLMGALQHVHIPGYSAIIFRKTLTDLKMAEALLDRAHQWLSGKSGVRYVASEHCFYFDTRDPNYPAKVQFGYVGEQGAKVRYQGIAVQYTAFDEVTQHNERDYVYMFSRLRRLVCPIHQLDAAGKPNFVPGCRDCAERSSVPIRMRCASNPGGIGHCVPFGEVLTVHSGWKPIQKVKVGEEVYSVDPSSRKLVTKRVQQTHSSRFQGELVHVNTGTMKAWMTANHKVLYTDSKSSSWRLQPFENLPGQAIFIRSALWEDGNNPETFTVPPFHTRTTKLNQPDTISFTDYASLMGWFLSEGHTLDRDKEFGISQYKANHRDTIRELLVRCGFQFRESKIGFQVSSPKWWSYLRQFGKCRDKYIPDCLKNASSEAMACLLTSLMAGDGHRGTSSTGGDYYTISKQLADDVTEVAIKLGYIVSVNTRSRESRKGLSYRVSFKRTKSQGTEILTGHHTYQVVTTTKRRSNIERQEFDGTVYCLGIEDTHNFILRQKGCVWVSGNSWVKERFQIKPTTDPFTGTQIFRGFNPNRPFIPAYVEDNKYLDQASYIEGLSELDPVTRAQLRSGNWEISEDARFKPHWAKYYSIRGEYFVMGANGRGGPQYHRNELIRVFTVCDPAGSAREGPGDELRFKKERSWTVISTFGLTPDYNLLWLDMKRLRCEIPDIITELKATCRKWRPQQIIIETNGLGRGAYQSALRVGLPMKGITQHRDKVVRSTDAQVRMEAGKIWLPETAGWLDTCREELFSWTGHPDMTDDIVDTLSMAASEVSWEAASVELDTTLNVETPIPFVVSSNYL